MKLITFYSETHKPLYEIFVNSFSEFLSEKCVLLTKKIEQKSPTGVYNSEGFDLTMVEKLDWIIENINISDTQPLIYSDCDVQFFGELKFDLSGKDILFSHDFHESFDYSWYPDNKIGKSNHPNYCAGFFICNQNEVVLNFFKEVKSNLLQNLNGKLHDQIVMNKLIGEGYEIKHDKLDPNYYWTSAFSTNGKIWNGQTITVPNTILVHHANFTVGLQNKINLLKLVKEQIR